MRCGSGGQRLPGRRSCPVRQSSGSTGRGRSSTSRSRSGRSVMIPSTPASSSRTIDGWSLTVQTTTFTPIPCAPVTSRSTNTCTRPSRSGTCRNSAVANRRAGGIPARAQVTTAARARQPSAVRTPGTWARTTSRHPSHAPAMQTRSRKSLCCNTLVSAGMAERSLRSTVNLASGNASRASVRVGIGSRPSTRSCRSDARVCRATGPRPSVTRSRVASWKQAS